MQTTKSTESIQIGNSVPVQDALRLLAQAGETSAVEASPAPAAPPPSPAPLDEAAYRGLKVPGFSERTLWTLTGATLLSGFIGPHWLRFASYSLVTVSLLNEVAHRIWSNGTASQMANDIIRDMRTNKQQQTTQSALSNLQK